MATRELTVGKPLKLILLFMVPIFLGNLFQMFYNFTDAIIVGRIIGIEALGAIGATSSLIYLVISFIFAATQGFSVVLGQRFGAKDYDMVKKSFASSIILSVLMTLVLTLLFAPYARQMLQFLRTPSDILDMSTSYLCITFLGIAATVFYNLFSNVIRALGDAKTPLYFLILASILNVALDLLFITKLNFGVSGAALATVLSQFLSAILCLIYMHYQFPILRLEKKDWKVGGEFLYEHARIGFPMGFQISILTIGKIVLQFVLNGFGTMSVAAFTTGMRVDQMFFQIYLALGITMANYTAQNFGANKISRIKEGAKIGIILTLIVSVISILILGFFSEPIVALFMKTPNPEIVALASQYLHTIMIFLFFLGTLLIYRNILQGIGSVAAPVISGVAELVVRAFGAVILGYYFNYAGLCFATPLAWLVGAIVLFSGYRLALMHNFKKKRKARRT